MRRFLSVLCLLTLACTGGAAQKLDSILHHTRPALMAYGDGRNTWLLHHEVIETGYKLGLQWEKKYRLGIGYYLLSSHPALQRYYNGRLIPAQVRFEHVTAFAEYAFYQTYRWEFAASGQFGMGSTYFLPEPADANTYNSFDKGVALLLEPGVNGYYRIYRWVGVSGGIGYRQMLLPAALGTKGFSGAFLSLSLKIFVGDLYNDVYGILFPSKSNNTKAN